MPAVAAVQALQFKQGQGVEQLQLPETTVINTIQLVNSAYTQVWGSTCSYCCCIATCTAAVLPPDCNQYCHLIATMNVVALFHGCVEHPTLCTVQFATSIKDYMFSCMIQQRKAADGALLTGQAHPDTAGAAAGGCHGGDSGSGGGGGGGNIKAAAAWPSLATAATASALPVGRPADEGSAASAPAGAQQEGRVSFMLLDMRHLLNSVPGAQPGIAGQTVVLMTASYLT
jgi:hypothetical protein